MNGLDGKLDDVNVLHFIVSADVVHLSFTAFTHNHVYCLAVVFNVEPVSDIQPFTIDREFLSLENVVDDQWNQLLREMIGAIVVGASGDADRHVIGIAVCHYEMVGTGLAGRIRTVRTERCLFREITFSSQRAINFIGRHLMVTFPGLPGGVALSVLSCHPRTACSIHEVLCSEDVHRQEELRIFNRTINMALCGEIDKIVDVVFRKQTVNEFTVTDVSLHEEAPLIVNIVFDGSEVACIGEGIEDDYLDVVIQIFLMKQVLDVVGADESGSSCY